MNWFKPKFNATECCECGVFFSTVNGPFAEYCHAHRTPLLERKRRKDMVIAWATENWERFEDQAHKEIMAQSAAYNESISKQTAAMQQSNAGTNPYGGFGDILGRMR